MRQKVYHRHMTKRRISDRQAVRIKQHQKKRSSEETGEEGLLIAHYGKYVDIETTDGKIIRCNLRQNLGVLVPGDRVIWHPTDAENTGVLVSLKPRHSLLSRPTAPGKNKLIAANVDQMIIVMAMQPKSPTSLIDSYLVAAETLNLDAMILLNKVDLLNNDRSLQEQLQIYQQIGYPVIETSIQKNIGINQLNEALQKHTSILVGQSGVGKSSLIAALIPTETIRVATEDVAHGTHTTTTARLYHLPHGGDLIDSPGIREFTLWDMPADQIAMGFVEFRSHLGQCQFRDCLHQNETNCAIINAAAQGKISAARLTNYQRILALCASHS